jgi:SAM-dependent methyltransferase
MIVSSFPERASPLFRETDRMESKPHLSIVSYCEEWLKKHGDNALGVGWPRGDAQVRYRVMMDLIRPSFSAVTMLDFGCGASHLYQFILDNGIEQVRYSGLDLSDQFLQLSKRKFPSVPYYRVDVLDPLATELPSFDYIVMNGIFNYKGALSHEDMFAYLRDLVRRISEKAAIGIAFNVMTKQVDWERDDLFHLPVDRLLTFLSRDVSRHVVIRHDYGLYEYTVYVYKSPTLPEQSAAKRLVDGKRSP